MNRYQTKRGALRHTQPDGSFYDRQCFFFSEAGLPYDYDPHHVINELTKNRKDISYLEIGVDQGHTFDKVEGVTIKHGVDPYGASKNITHRMSSQMFFAMNERFFKHKYDFEKQWWSYNCHYWR